VVEPESKTKVTKCGRTTIIVAKCGRARIVHLLNKGGRTNMEQEFGR